MSYHDTIQWLFSLQKHGIKLGLDTITLLLKVLGNPHLNIPCVHVGGTNGKGSTAAFLSTLLQQTGYRVGLFTSPHLVDFTERIRINSTCIPEEQVVLITEELRKVCESSGMHTITFFEFTTALALVYFHRQHVDIMILEVGMGGRYDATNIVNPLVAVITTVALEHQMFLGRTLKKIAVEKAGIIKKRSDVISGVSQITARRIIQLACNENDARLYQLGIEFSARKRSAAGFSYRGITWNPCTVNPGLAGDHQFRNASLALATAEVLAQKGYSRISPSMAVTAVEGTCWPGRMEVVRTEPFIVLDGAHNPAAWKACRKTLDTCFFRKRLLLIIGVMEDKDIRTLHRLFATKSTYAIVCCRPEMERAAGKDVLSRFFTFSETGPTLWEDTTQQAIDRCVGMADAEDLICVTGSLFVVGEARRCIIGNGVKSVSGPIGM